MVKRDLVIKYNIRFDEVVYSADVYFSMLVGYHADIIKVTNMILYVVTFRPKSLSAEFCTKPGELKTRAEVFFREDLLTKIKLYLYSLLIWARIL